MTKVSLNAAASLAASVNGEDTSKQALSGVAVPLRVESPCPASAGQPVTVGVPFPRGALTAVETLELLDPAGRPLDLQALPLARWSDGSVKWLLVDFVLGPVAPVDSLTLRPNPGTTDRPRGAQLRIEESPQAIVIDTGLTVFHLDRRVLRPLTRARLGDADVLDPRLARVVLTDARGRAGEPRVEQAVVETAGPVRATVRLEGVFTGRLRCRFVARCCFFAGTGLVRLRLTVHNANRARHPGGLWDLGDPGSMLFQDLALELGIPGPEAPRVAWRAEAGQPLRPAGAERLEIYQDSSGGVNWQSKNHRNRDGRVPCSFRGYRVRGASPEAEGLRASPVVCLGGPAGVLTAALPEFWQQFPKALEVDGRLLRLRLFPQQFADLFELQGGEQKTHTVWLHFGPPEAAGGCPLDWVEQPAGVRVAPEWYAAAGVIPYLAPRPDGPADRLEELLAGVVGGANSVVARREVIDEYGWRNFGEIYADHEATYYQGPRPVISHYNNQYDVIYGALLQYLRSSDGRWFGLFDPLARHVMDIDIYHTDRDRAAYNHGLFWFTDHYKDAATSTHRTYSRHNCRPGERSYGGGPSSNHNFTTGLLYYYYLTGDPRAREAVLGLADWVLAMDDGTKNILGLIDPGPTGLASCTGELGYHGPGRGAGNSINALLDAWLLTGDRKYLDQAEVLLRRAVHPADDVTARDLLSIEKRWSYTVFFSTLARYLGLKLEAGQLDAMYAYAQASLVRYATWMADHEVPYFDRPGMEYPTEVWAAQEFRKANVLRLAAAHVDEPLRARFLRRGHELAERGWSDLLRFESRTVARSVAILMVEGVLDSYFRGHPVAAAPRAPGGYDFGQPEEFVAQKHRVLAQLKTARGLARALARLADVRNWWAFLRRRPRG